MINELWARYQVFRVVFVISFLVFITAVSIYVAYTLYQVGLFHFFSIVFILLLLALQKGIFKRMGEALGKRTSTFRFAGKAIIKVSNEIRSEECQ